MINNKNMLNKIEISINKNYYTIKYNGFSKKTTNNELINNLLNKDYGHLINYVKTGNDLILNFQRVTIIIKSIRNIKKFGNDQTLYNYLNTLNNEKLLKLVK